MDQMIEEKIRHIKAPKQMGSYKPFDCVFLLKNINGLLKEQSNEERETAIQSGVHYSEMLPIEYMPTPEYIALYEKMLNETAYKIAYYVGVVSEMMYRKKGKDLVIVSLARAGTPIGVLIKRYLWEKYQINAMHYSISIIRDKGIDENALFYILAHHEAENIQFVDGWTGKGVIGKTLTKACKVFKEKYDIVLDDTLAVLCDPGECTSIYGTREDFLVPSACLNATVSGLMSRTFLRDDIIGENDFHGAKYYEEWQEIDRSNEFVDKISSYFKDIVITEKDLEGKAPGQYNAAESVENIRKHFEIETINRVKPGVGETTRVLLRRIPWKILVRDENDPNLRHIFQLAKERGVMIEQYDKMCYSCCGLIKKVK